jgi:hypothetical protein
MLYCSAFILCVVELRRVLPLLLGLCRWALRLLTPFPGTSSRISYRKSQVCWQFRKNSVNVGTLELLHTVNTKPLPVVMFPLFLSTIEPVFQLNFQNCAWL